jgi:hypothetical protein
MRLNIHGKDVERRLAWLCNGDGTNKGCADRRGSSRPDYKFELHGFGRRSFGQKIILAACVC